MGRFIRILIVPVIIFVVWHYWPSGEDASVSVPVPAPAAPITQNAPGEQSYILTMAEAQAINETRYPDTKWIGPEDGDWISYVCREYGECVRPMNYVPAHYPDIVRSALQYPGALKLQSLIQGWGW